MDLRKLLFAHTIAIATVAAAQADIENVVVETYYITDANDATDTIGNNPGLSPGSRTYRVFVDLCDSCALRAVYGDTNHVFTMQSTALIINHNDRGKTYGHEINDARLDEGTVALDSWLSMGAASSLRYGVLKAEDNDGSVVGGPVNNDGGSAQVAGGLLANTDPGAGIPLVTSDGLVPLNGGQAVPPNFTPLGNDPDPAFADSTLVSAFTTNNFRMSCISPGVKGPTGANKVLIAQVTTSGDLTFCLNLEIEKPNGSVIRYVATDSLLQPGETANGLLKYPPQCGCTDPDFLEFDPTAGCDDGSCQTTIVFGCLDTLACNYDPLANFNISLLCCYGPDSCNGLDISLVCPDVGFTEPIGTTSIRVYPNPATNFLYFEINVPNGAWVEHLLTDATGRRVRSLVRERMVGQERRTIDLQGLAPGPYFLSLTVDGKPRTVPVFRVAP